MCLLLLLLLLRSLWFQWLLFIFIMITIIIIQKTSVGMPLFLRKGLRWKNVLKHNVLNMQDTLVFVFLSYCYCFSMMVVAVGSVDSSDSNKWNAKWMKSSLSCGAYLHMTCIHSLFLWISMRLLKLVVLTFSTF